jgi:hypothetical protein
MARAACVETCWVAEPAISDPADDRGHHGIGGP